MARIEWVVLCERAFLDGDERLSMIGVATHFHVPSLPLAINQIVMVARLVDARHGDPMEVGVAIGTPGGRWSQPTSDGFDIDQAGEYLLITLREVPFTEAGAYRFAVALGQQEVIVDVPVTLMAASARLTVH